MDENAVILRGRGRERQTREAERVLAMHDLDLVAGAPQRASERLHIERVAAEVIRRIEGRDHAEAHQAPPDPAARSRLAIVIAAARVQENCGARARALRRSASESAASPAIRAISVAIDVAERGSKKSPASPTTSGTAPTSPPSTGTPQATASMAG